MELTQKFISEKGEFMVALSGGSTPEALYSLLAEDEFSRNIEWERIHLFWGDERCVPPSHKDSNYLMVYNSLISKVNIPKRNIHRIRGEAGEDGAAQYEMELKKIFNLQEGITPKFDLILLGIGEDAHTASLFPETFDYNTPAMVTSVYVKKLNAVRISLTPLVIRNAANITVLVSGIKKAPPLAKIFDNKFFPEKYPAEIITAAGGNVIWLIDRAAASLLK